MRRKPTKTTRGPNANERRLRKWVKDQPCCICNDPGPSIVDHMYGSTFKHMKILIGHAALLPYCHDGDMAKTIHGRAEHDRRFRRRQADIWGEFIENSPIQPPEEFRAAILDWGR